MNLAEEAFSEMYPEKEDRYDFSIKYSGRFSDFNANVRKYGNKISFSLSKRWKQVGKDIKKGLLQELLGKLFKKRETENIRLYNIFIKKVHIAATKIDSDPHLIESFNRINEQYFYGNIEMPNLKFGRDAMRTLGSYNYHNDTITISGLLRYADPILMDYIMYHELLHKKLKFHSKKGRSVHHTREFKRLEKEFPNHAMIEKRLTRLKSG